MAYVFHVSSVLFERYRKHYETLKSIPVTHGEYSVFISAYNAKNYITETLDSILNSTILPYEIIIVNDASTDDTYKVIKEHLNRYSPSKVNAQRLRYIHKVYNEDVEDEFELEIYRISYKGQSILVKLINNRHNLGKTLNLNKVVFSNLVEREYLLSIDADTIIPRDHAELLLKLLKRDPKIAVAFGAVLPRRDIDTVIGRILERGRRFIYRLSFLTFRNAGNFLDFHYGLSGACVMYRVAALREVPRPYDSYAGDTSHAWELQRKGWKIHSEWRTYKIVYDPSTLRETLRQRIRWSSGPYQNLYLRGIQTIKDCFRISKKRGIGALYTIIYYSFLSTKYNLTYLSLLPLSFLIPSLQSWAIKFYLLDILAWLLVSSLATYYFNKYYEKRYGIKISLSEYVKDFLSFYFIFKPIIALSQICAMAQTIYDIMRRKKWFGKN